MRTNIITGAFGFIGSHLARYLAEHYPDEHLVLIDYASAMTPERIRYLPYALAKAEVVPLRRGEVPDWSRFYATDTILYHMGAVSSTQASVGGMLEDNFEGIQEIAEEFVGSVVFASSMSVYGNTQSPQNPKGEIQPQTPYAMSKRSAELTLARARSGKKRPTLIARFANVFGRNENHKLEETVTFGGTIPHSDMRSLPSRVLLDTLAEGIPGRRDIEVYQPSTEYARDFVYVKRAVEALVAAERTLDMWCQNPRLIEIGRGEAMQWDSMALQIAGAYSCLSPEFHMGGCTTLDVRKIPDPPSSVESPGYQRYTQACSPRLLENTSTVREDILDMFREERPDSCHSWGTDYGPAIRSRLTTSGDHDILRVFS